LAATGKAAGWLPGAGAAVVDTAGFALTAEAGATAAAAARVAAAWLKGGSCSRLKIGMEGLLIRIGSHCHGLWKEAVGRQGLEQRNLTQHC
jgi:hypothetical protein